MTAPDELLAPVGVKAAQALQFARDLAHPDWSLSVPAPAKRSITGLLAALDGVLALHSVDEHECECGEVHGPFCAECVGESWPCPTVAAVTTALEGQA